MDFNQGYQPKDLHFAEQGRARLINGVVKMAKAVKSTLGPSGNTVLIESPTLTNGITVTKDGVTVAKVIDLIDPVENLAVKMMKEAADKTATSAGDGTTTAIVLTEALVLAANEHMTATASRTEVLRHMSNMCDWAVENLRNQSEKVTMNMIADVAALSANNDKELGKVIAGVYKSVGKNGIVTVEKSQTSVTYTETTKGFKVARGYSSPLFVNDQKRDECVLEDTMVLVSDAEITSVLQLENILKPIISEGKKLLIIAPCNANVLNTLAANVMKGILKCCVIAPPNFGYKQHELMHDIAVSVGAVYYSEKTGDDLSLIHFGDLGHCARVIIDRDSAVLVKSGARSNQQLITERVEQLWSAHKEAKRKSDKDFILERIASLTGGVGVIYVGGQTDLEQKELYDRVDDAVSAVRSALEEGILPGAGKALSNINFGLDYPPAMSSVDKADLELHIALKIMSNACNAPLIQILENAGLDASEVYSTDNIDRFGLFANKQGYNVKTGAYGNLIDMGVIDPLKVTRCALQNAVSVATTILSTNAIVTMARSYETK
jgi:chaperonin GroEL